MTPWLELRDQENYSPVCDPKMQFCLNLNGIFLLIKHGSSGHRKTAISLKFGDMAPSHRAIGSHGHPGSN